MPLDIVVGTQWGDEGKGRFVDLLAGQTDYVARFNGGDNAGHTVNVGENTFRLHLIPSGIAHPHPVAVIGNGVVINPKILLSEIESLTQAGIDISPERLLLSYGAHIISPAHLALDKAQETSRGKSQLGTTLRGIGPAYTSKVSRQGLRLIEMLDLENFTQRIEEHITEINQQLVNLYNLEPLDSEAVIHEMIDYAKSIRPFIGDISTILTEALIRGKRVLAEGAQGTLLDLDHGTYPFVTSSNPTAAGALTGLGLGLGFEERIIGVTKSFQSRVGSGPFPTELTGELAHHLRGSGDQPWDEFGTTTGRPRRVGWLDAVLLRYAVRVNGLTELAITKLDVLSGLEEIKICSAYRLNQETIIDLPYGPNDLSSYEPLYEQIPGWEEDIREVRNWEDLPQSARRYILRIEELSKLPIRLISVGPERGQFIEIH